MSNQKYNPKWDPKNENIYTALPANTDEKKPDIKLVWLLNLFPYFGAGYFYALGVKGAIVPMLFIWSFMLIFGPGTLVPMYFILSVLGTAHILNKNHATVTKLRQATFGKEVHSVLSGKQIPMNSSTDFSLSTLESKATKAKRALNRMTAEDDAAKSKHAFEAFEYKAQAAEKMLKAREAAAAAGVVNKFDPDTAINFAPAEAPRFSDDETDESSGMVVPQTVSVVTAPTPVASPQAAATQDSVSSDYINQVSNSYSIDAEVSNITAGVNVGASANSAEVNNFLAQESASIQSPNMVPEVASQIAASDSYVPNVSDTLVPSLGSFESPKFSFSFEDHMATSMSGVADSTSATTTTPCPKCGAAKDINFSFCLACGQSFL